nr:fimbrillin family protein [Parabacteroides goldsteinii]
MSKNLFLAMALVGIVLSAACSKEEPVGGSKQVAATFTAGIEPHTKAYDTTWEKGDRIGITAYEDESLVIDYQNTNCTFEGSGGSSVDWLPAKTYFYEGTDVVTFKAYYPYTQSISSSKIPVDATLQGQPGEQKKIDFLYASGTGSQASPEVNLRFSHKMSKLIFNITRENENTNEDFKTLNAVLEGVKQKGEFDVTTGVVTASDEEAEQLQLTHTGTDENRSVTLIVVPQDLPAATLTITIGKNVYKADIPFTEALNPGKSYLFNITVKNSSLIVDDSDIADWNAGNGTGKDVDAEVSLPDAVKVGDFFYADGTWGSTLDGNKTCIGLVFSTVTSQKDKDRGWRNGYVIALKNTGETVRWAPSLDVASNVYITNEESAFANMDGYAETQLICNISDYGSKFPAFAAVRNFKADQNEDLGETSGWYIPSSGQWHTFVQNFGPGIEDINSYMLNRAGIPFAVNALADYFVSSTEFNNLNYWGLLVGRSSAPYLVKSTSKFNMPGYVRPVLAF